jgi:hypothetical protein
LPVRPASARTLAGHNRSSEIASIAVRVGLPA